MPFAIVVNIAELGIRYETVVWEIVYAIMAFG